MDLMQRRRAMMQAAQAAGLKWKTGSFALSADTNANNMSNAEIQIPHGLGAVPEMVIVWTEDYSQDNLPETGLMGGFIMIPDLLTDLKERLSSVNSSAWNTYVPLVITSEGLVNPTAPTSTSYFPTSRLPTESIFYLTYQGPSTYWRSGVTYKYFVAAGWR